MKKQNYVTLAMLLCYNYLQEQRSNREKLLLKILEIFGDNRDLELSQFFLYSNRYLQKR